ncbi:MAG: 5'-methylthioadenosine/adenosylhomocysteine nucleosidase [Tissierellia bacterium]|jgi:adenosylhomocysteine nucleosidase|nr:5'-methylthioadenosine/adenosylhomocysteine nucleosidase [Tissierellia bacterium]
MKIAIVAALEAELSHLKERIGPLEAVPCPGGAFHTGHIGPHEVALVRLNIGKVNAACKTQAVIDRFHPALIINTGIAGALSPDVHVLDTVIGTQLGYHDFDPALMGSFPPYVQSFAADAQWVHAAAQAADAQKIPWKKGPITTGDLFVSSHADKERIYGSTGALCVEMEGCAVAHTAFLNEIPFLILRAISDSADDAAETDYDTFEQKAADRSAQLLLALLMQAV